MFGTVLNALTLIMAVASIIILVYTVQQLKEIKKDTVSRLRNRLRESELTLMTEEGNHDKH